MLARELRELEVNGVVQRFTVTTAPSTVASYQLTQSGQNLEAVIVGMAQWGVEHRALAAKKSAASSSEAVQSSSFK